MNTTRKEYLAPPIRFSPFWLQPVRLTYEHLFGHTETTGALFFDAASLTKTSVILAEP